jgi:HEAT repeat protein
MSSQLALLISFTWSCYSIADRMPASVQPAKEQIPYFLVLLKDEDAAIRVSAANNLGELGPDAISAIPALMQALDDANTNVINSAMHALSRIGDMAVPFLITALDHKCSRVRLLALEALPHLQSKSAKSAVPTVVRLLRKHEDTYTRAAAADAILDFQAECAIPDLIDALIADEDRDVCHSILVALLNFGPPAKAAIPIVTAIMLNDPLDELDPLADLASDTLAYIGSDAVPALLDVLQESNYPLQRRRLALNALSRVARNQDTDLPKRGVLILLENLRDEDEDYRIRSLEVLEAMGKRAGAALEKVSKLVKEDESECVRVKAARTLYSIDPGNSFTIPAIILGLKASSWNVRSVAAHAAGSIGKPALDAVPALIQALKDENQRVRYEVAAALGAIGPDAKAAIPALEKALKDRADCVRKEAGRALKEIKTDK